MWLDKEYFAMNWIYAVRTLIIAHLTGLPTSTNGQNQGKSIRVVYLLILSSVFSPATICLPLRENWTEKKGKKVFGRRFRLNLPDYELYNL